MFYQATGYLPSQHKFKASLPSLINSQRKLASYFPDEIVDYIFYWEKEGDEYLFQIKFLVKQNLNVELYHNF